VGRSLWPPCRNTQRSRDAGRDDLSPAQQVDFHLAFGLVGDRSPLAGNKPEKVPVAWIATDKFKACAAAGHGERLIVFADQSLREDCCFRLR
jgi:hypothetical protein